MDSKAAMSGGAINDLPDSAFAYIEPGGKKDSGGRTTPRSLRHFPIHDAAHVRNALARAPQSPFGPKAMPKIAAAAKKLGIGQKALGELKAEPMDGNRLERWLTGLIPRRVLVLPFGGTIPAEKFGYHDGKARDLDGEYFDADTDIYGPYKTLRNTRSRLTDWHHDDSGVPDWVASMKGAIVGRVVLDESPEKTGVWADFWANVGEARRKLFAELEERHVPLFGSSEAVPGSVRSGKAGHIDVWPIIRHTITTSPQNRLAVVPPLKAWLSDPDTNLGDLDPDALKAYLVGQLDNPDNSESTPAGRDEDEARRVSTEDAIRELLAEGYRGARLRGLL